MGSRQTILVTGGAGFIGSHTVVELLAADCDVVVIDNLCNSRISVLARIGAIAGRMPVFVEADVRDRAALRAVFEVRRIDAVIHFAGLKAVGESVAKPLAYYDNNVCGVLALTEVMAAAGVFKLAFSSSATVYGNPHGVPICEDFPLAATNPYGRSKLMIEQILRDVAHADPAWSIALLRYFNPVGAHPSGLIGEDPLGVPNNLMPFAVQVAAGLRPELQVFGGDYPTPDGTGVRDYIHVMDVAAGHVAALRALEQKKGAIALNLGTGRGYSVLEVVQALARASARPVPHRIVERRPGDIAQCFADASLATRVLGWKAVRNLEEMCTDSWRWQCSQKNL